MASLQTVVELPEFLRRAEAIMSAGEHVALPSYIAVNPGGGRLAGCRTAQGPDTREDSGKSGGYRTIHVFFGTDVPMLLVTLFAKSEKDNLTRAEQAEAIALAEALDYAQGKEIYVFRAKRSDRVKLVWWDGTGLCLMATKFESGGSKWPAIQDGVMRPVACSAQVLRTGR